MEDKRGRRQTIKELPNIASDVLALALAPFLMGVVLVIECFSRIRKGISRRWGCDRGR